jgi:hypothetical protein
MSVPVSIKNKATLGERSIAGPALGVHNGKLWMAWIGDDNKQLNVVQVVLRGDGTINIDPATKQIMAASSDGTPSLASFKGRLWMAWIGQNNRQLNVMGSRNGNDFDSTTLQIMSQTSDITPRLAAFGEMMWLAWSGRGNSELNVIGSLNGNDFNSTTIRTFPDLVGSVSGLCFYRGQLRMLWVDGGGHLNVMSSDAGNAFDVRTKFILPPQPGTNFNADCVLSTDMWGASSFHAFRHQFAPMHVSRVYFAPEVNRWAQSTGDITGDLGIPAIAAYQQKLVIAWLGDDLPHHLNLGFIDPFVEIRV